MTKEKLTAEDAQRCPFCGLLPTIEPWHGGGPRKRLVSCCETDMCPVGPSVTGPTRQVALDCWNTRE